LYRLHLQVRRLTQAINQQKLAEGCLPPASTGLLLRLVFHPENGGDVFLRNAWFSPKYTALKPNLPYPLPVDFLAFSVEAYKSRKLRPHVVIETSMNYEKKKQHFRLTCIRAIHFEQFQSNRTVSIRGSWSSSRMRLPLHTVGRVDIRVCLLSTKLVLSLPFLVTENAKSFF
jgi:hypothetical protein